MGICGENESKKDFHLSGYIDGKKNKKFIDTKPPTEKSSRNSSNNKSNIEKSFEGSLIKEKDNRIQENPENIKPINNPIDNDNELIKQNIVTKIPSNKDESKIENNNDDNDINYGVVGSRNSNLNQFGSKISNDKFQENDKGNETSQKSGDEFKNHNNNSKKEISLSYYENLDINTEYYLVCPECNFYIIQINSAEYDSSINDYIIGYQCLCLSSINENKEKCLHRLLSSDKKKCDEHSNEEIELYCQICKKQICSECQKNSHINHEIQKIINKNVIPESIMNNISDKKDDFKGYNIFQKLYNFYKNSDMLTNLPKGQDDIGRISRKSSEKSGIFNNDPQNYNLSEQKPEEKENTMDNLDDINNEKNTQKNDDEINNQKISNQNEINGVEIENKQENIINCDYKDKLSNRVQLESKQENDDKKDDDNLNNNMENESNIEKTNEGLSSFVKASSKVVGKESNNINHSKSENNKNDNNNLKNGSENENKENNKNSGNEIDNSKNIQSSIPKINNSINKYNLLKNISNLGKSNNNINNQEEKKSEIENSNNKSESKDIRRSNNEKKSEISKVKDIDNKPDENKINEDEVGQKENKENHKLNTSVVENVEINPNINSNKNNLFAGNKNDDKNNIIKINDINNTIKINNISHSGNNYNISESTKNKETEDFIIQNNSGINDINIINAHKSAFINNEQNKSRVLKKYKNIKTFTGHEDKIVSLIKLNSGYIATGSYDFSIKIWNIEKNPDQSLVVSLFTIGYALCLLELKPNILLVGNSENSIDLFNLNENSFDPSERLLGHYLWVIALVNCDENHFASASNDAKIFIWDSERRIKLYELEGHDDCILTMILLNNGNLCSGSADNTIRIWDWKNKRCLNYFEAHKNWVKCLLEFNDNILISSSDDKTIKIWDKNQNMLSEFDEHQHSVRALCKIDDNYFASGSFDKTIKIWDFNEKKCIQTLEGHKDNVICIIKYDNKLISCSSDKTVKIWEEN